jgi:hypothetical protein
MSVSKAQCESFQYRIENPNEHDERAAKERVEERFNSSEIGRLYQPDDYPLGD